jgi:YidC/Oxa1 family membrane protein insertase
MDEKRALIAIILIFVVFMVFNTVFNQRRKPVEVPDETVQEEVIEEPDTTLAEIIDLDVTAGEAPVKETVVATPLYTGRFSSVGGVITSLRLNEFLGVDDKPVELIPESGKSPLAVALLLTTGDRINLSGANWHVSSESLYVGEGSDARLIFELTTESGLSVSKVCRFDGDAYMIGVDVEVAGPGSGSVRAIELGWESGLRVTEPHRKGDDLRYFAAVALSGEEFQKMDRGDVKKRGGVEIGGDIKWSGLKTKYFLAAFLPQGGEQATASFTHLSEEAIGMKLQLDRQGPGPQEFNVYAGPLDYRGLKAMGSGLEEAVDFGWSIIAPLAKIVYRFMLFCQGLIPNYGLVIIVLSLLIKILFYPLTQKSMKSMRAMQRLQPKMKELRETHKKDPQRLNQEMMKLYKEHGVNPVGGCLPMLLQMPVFFALFQVLNKAIELRRAPFALWIRDLSAPDVVAKLPFSLPFIGDNLSLLPILMGLAMFVQQKMQTTDPKQAAMMYMLPVVFTVLFFRFPSGLVLYWLVNNILTIGHQYLMTRTERLREVPTAGG